MSGQARDKKKYRANAKALLNFSLCNSQRAIIGHRIYIIIPGFHFSIFSNEIVVSYPDETLEIHSLYLCSKRARCFLQNKVTYSVLMLL
jgi:hypothetical protein